MEAAFLQEKAIMRYYHTYLPEAFEGMLKNGFITKDSGLRLCQNWNTYGTLDFNTFAKIGSELHSLIKNEGLGFYVDRLQGGIEFEDYTPDFALCSEYEQLIGDKFLGFQMHEWASNYLGEFKKLFNARLTEWSLDAITDAYKKLYPNSERLMTESMSAQELFELGAPSTLFHLYKNLDYLFTSRSMKTGCRLITCDSSALGFDYELKNGARNIMAEIGGQTEDARLQISYARGASKAHSKPFGTYYEPWGGRPLEAVRYNSELPSEWKPYGELNFAYSQGDQNSGSTRSLQRRLLFYSLFAGAEFMSEEWCLNTTFYDWQDFELTPYGKVKKEFLDFASKHDIGKPLTPAAAVLPKDFMFVNAIHENCDLYMGMPICSDFAKKVRTVRQGLCSIFSNAYDMQGNEYKEKPDGNAYVIINSKIPDAVDIIHEDSKTITDYKLLVDLTSNPAFKLAYGNTVSPEDLQKELEKLLPCAVDGNVSYITTDKRYLLIMNNDGVYYDAQKGEYADQSRKSSAKITFNTKASPATVHGEGVLRLENGEWYIDLPAGAISVIKY